MTKLAAYRKQRLTETGQTYAPWRDDVGRHEQRRNRSRRAGRAKTTRR